MVDCTYRRVLPCRWSGEDVFGAGDVILMLLLYVTMSSFFARLVLRETILSLLKLVSRVRGFGLWACESGLALLWLLTMS